LINNDRSYVYKEIIKMLKPYLYALGLAILSLVFSKLIEASIIRFLSPKLFDEVLVSRNLNEVRIVAIMSFGALLLRSGTGFITKFFIGYTTKNIAKDLRSKILTHMLFLPISFFKQNSTGNLISKVNYDVEQITIALSDSVCELLSSLVTILFFIAVMLSFSWQLTIMALLVVPLIAWFLRSINGRIRKYSTRLQNSVGDVSHLAHEIIDACQVIRIFEAVPQETQRIKQLVNYNFNQELKIVLVSAISESIILITLGLLFVGLIHVATAHSFKISAGAFVGLFGAMYGLIRPLKQLSAVNYVIAKGIAAADSIFALLSDSVEFEYIDTSGYKSNNINIVNNVKDYKFNPNSVNMGNIKLNNVSFCYATKLSDQPQVVLSSLNLVFYEGKTTAIVGRSGSGKSTLVALLPRFYQVTSGEILLNNTNINDLDLIELRKQFAMVNQRIVLLNDTIANNIAYGCMQFASRDQIIEAAIAANAMEFIEKLPAGLDTKIGNNGNLLSGGERQRIAIARAILKNAPILILDEATSALDSQSELKIQLGLEKLKTGKTTIIIAHRMSTIEHADQIVVLDGGKLVALGNHNDLSQDPYYINLHRSIIN
jgi:ATP-binding cassette, subfamily B, bacterial MsbA